MIIPKENEKDLAEIPESARKKLEIVPVATIDEVLRIALQRMPEPLPRESTEESPPVSASLAVPTTQPTVPPALVRPLN